VQSNYRIAAGKIAHQKIDGEVIVIHFDTGDYYSLSGTAVDLWEMLQQPCRLDDFRNRFANFDLRAEKSLRQFIHVLEVEGLIEAAGLDPDPAPGGPADAVTGSSPIPFQDPIVEKYSDMQTILLADPIHDVEEQGWPKVKSQD